MEFSGTTPTACGANAAINTRRAALRMVGLLIMRRLDHLVGASSALLGERLDG
jgi:hypothetical protein